MKDLIKKLLKENIESHSELQNLADTLFMTTIRYFVSKTIDTGKALSVYERVSDVFTKINKNRYKNLNSFLNEYTLGLRYSGKSNSLGDFVAHSETSGDIIVRYNLTTLKQSIEEIVLPVLKSGEQINQEMYNNMCNQVHGRLYDRKILSTILHELQHAYDSWRSQGMFMASKRGFDYDKKYSNDSTVTDKQRDDYDKLEYEINARFTQAIKEIQFYIVNYNMDPNKPKGLLTPLPFNVIKNKFEEIFGGYEKMTPNFKKRLIKRLAKYYDQVLDKVASHNKNLSMNHQ